MANRDEILAYAADLLDLEAFPDYGPMGMQVVGAPTVTRIACGVSASRELFRRAAELGAELLVVHHGILWNSDSRVVDERLKGRLQALFAGNITLAAYHLALDAHPEVGNNALVARQLGVEPDDQFAEIGVGGRLAQSVPVETFVERVRERVNADPIVFREGPDEVERVAVVTGGGERHLLDAARAGYDLFLSGEAGEPSLHDARELGINFVAAGHYATERLGVQRLAERLADRFGLEWSFIDLPNPV
jgi:dinuclear metal center YbgI/SA1388 family protein